jgi:hypothetical protein
MNFEGAIRGMRNPLNSWDKSDSFICKESEPMTLAKINEVCGKCPKENNCDIYDTKDHFIIGKNDLDLAQRLIKAGGDHRKFLRQIFVTVDITAPLYWWKEFDTYKVGTVANSCSTMHKIHDKEFTLDDFSHEHLFDGIDNVEGNSDMEYYENPTTCLDYVIRVMNYYRKKFIETKDKRYWWQMIQLLPTSYNQKRTVTLNYEVLRNIYGSRCNHKLDEWSIGFMEFIDSLPYAEELIKI